MPNIGDKASSRGQSHCSYLLQGGLPQLALVLLIPAPPSNKLILTPILHSKAGTSDFGHLFVAMVAYW